MIIEGYVFIPYQGQLRFRFESNAHSQFLRSDHQYDHRLGATSLMDYERVRPVTCRELIYSGKRQYDDKIREALETLMPELGANPKQARKVTIDTVKPFEQELLVELTILCVSK